MSASTRQTRLLNVALGVGIAAVFALVAASIAHRGPPRALVRVYNATSARLKAQQPPPHPPSPRDAAATPHPRHANAAYHDMLKVVNATAVEQLGATYTRTLVALRHSAPTATAQTTSARCRALGLPDQLPPHLRALEGADCAFLQQLTRTWAALDRACHSAHHRSPLHPWDTTWPIDMHDEVLIELHNLSYAAHLQTLVDLHSGHVQRGLTRWACTVRLAQDLGRAPGSHALYTRVILEETAWEVLLASLRALPGPLTDDQFDALDRTLRDLAQTPYDLRAVLDGVTLDTLYELTYHDTTGLDMPPMPAYRKPPTKPALKTRLSMRLAVSSAIAELEALGDAIALPPSARGARYDAIQTDAQRALFGQGGRASEAIRAADTLIRTARMRSDMVRLLVADARFYALHGRAAQTVSDLLQDRPELPAIAPFDQRPYTFATRDGHATLEVGPLPQLRDSHLDLSGVWGADDTVRTRRLVHPKPQAR